MSNEYKKGLFIKGSSNEATIINAKGVTTNISNNVTINNFYLVECPNQNFKSLVKPSLMCSICSINKI